MASVPPQKFTIELSREARRSIDRLSKAIEKLKVSAPNFDVAKINEALRENFPDLGEHNVIEGWTDSTLITIGPECFTDGTGVTINYKGDNFYKGCGKPVEKNSTCVKRINHPSAECEDWDGNTREN